MVSLCDKYCKFNSDLDGVAKDSEYSCKERGLAVKNMNPSVIRMVRDEGNDCLNIDIALF